MKAARLQPSRRAIRGSAASQPGTPQHAVPTSYFCWKRSLDLVLAAVLVLPAIPLIALLVLLVRLTSRGPGIFRQARVGKDGRVYMMCKIRTMRYDAEAATGPVWTQAGDPRVTPMGKALRKLHLDELPQLFNVLRGDMSLVGPRPERPEFVRVLSEAVPGYANRLTVRPGVTGLAQVNLPPDSDLDSVNRKLVLDCEYIASAGWWLDVRLVLCTFLRILRVSERWLLRALGLARSVTLPVSSAELARCNGHRAARANATPVEILIQAAQANDASSNGSSQKHAGQRLHPR